jgi:hypothetical protein
LALGFAMRMRMRRRTTTTTRMRTRLKMRRRMRTGELQGFGYWRPSLHVYQPVCGPERM